MVYREMSDKVEYIRRFSLYRIVEHLVLIALFVVLAVTGLSQKFHALGISQSIIIALGGVDSVRFLHHVAGVFFTALALQHILANFSVIVFRQGEPSMLITVKDAQDALHNVRYYLGLADQPVMCDRYSYKEKFIYWLILLGGIQQIITGFILWFPVAATKYLPGQFIPAAKAVHTNEAMLIFLLMAIWHIYDSMFSPEVFPLNKSIFTGYAERRPETQEKNSGNGQG
ncbi:MAG TPA: cytochrome b/b6 domain-containing protein [Nitrospirota bacterium]|nr:cytochrome b/b6 domain-containing protein [Nitrospirota bacterium]